MTQILCGVDVAARQVYARIGADGAEGCFPNTAEGILALAAFCRTHGAALAVMEATGGDERQVFALLWAEGLPAAVVNPRAVRRFAEGMGCLEKTDRLDAGLIAAFAAARGVTAEPPPEAAQEQLRALVRRLRQLVELRAAQRQQQRLVREPAVREGFAALLALVTAQIQALEEAIAGRIAQDPLWRALDRVFREIKGVAGRTVARLMAELPEIGTLSGKAVGKLAGLAPLARDSGQSRGRRTVRGGRAGVRSILYVVAVAVRRHNPDFAAFAQRLTAAGKPKKVIRTALAHKLLTRLNAKAREVRQQLALQPA